MPNWTQNTITFKGNSERISELKNHIISIDEDGNDFFDFNRVIPSPEELKETSADSMSYSLSMFFQTEENPTYELYLSSLDSTTISEHIKTNLDVDNYNQKYELFLKYGALDWYQWNTKNWGCKWNSSETCVDESPNEIEISFQTPWGQPIPILGKLYELYHDLELEIQYEHEGGFGGANIKWNPIERTFTTQDLEEQTVYYDEEGNLHICGYDEENDDHLDKDGNSIDDVDYQFLPVGEPVISFLDESLAEQNEFTIFRL